jgi:hypothetical protein
VADLFHVGRRGGESRTAADETLRATQTLVSHMNFCWTHPTVVLLEVGWRWLVGIPFLAVVWLQIQQILLKVPPESVGLDKLNFQNPWQSSYLLMDAVGAFHPAVVAVLRWLAPVGMVAWAVASGIGRTVMLQRMRSLDEVDAARGSWARKIPGMIVLQGAWIVALIAVFALWYESVAWVASKDITSATEPDLIGFLCWLILLSLGLYVAWALLSWSLAMAPVLYFEQRDGGLLKALTGCFRLGQVFSGKLMEVNLVMGIVKIALIVLAMVFSAAPLPFSDEFGPGALHFLYVIIGVAFLIGNDFFHAVRLRIFVALQGHYQAASALKRISMASAVKISAFAHLESDFACNVLDAVAVLLTDESSLWDFTFEDSLESRYRQIRQCYGVDASDIEGALIWKILERIEKSRSRPASGK